MRQVRFVLPLAVVVCAAALFQAGGQHGSAITADCIITVNSTGDDVTDNAVITLREAISFATDAAAPGALEAAQIEGCGGSPGAGTDDLILFDSISVFPATISLGLGLPTLSTGGDEVDGTGAGVIVDGVDDTLVCFAVNSSGNRIRGLQVEDCLVAIWIDGTGGDVNYNTVGGSMAGEGNVLRGNGTGLRIEGIGASGNMAQGNFIGTNAAGTIAAGNGTGVVLDDAPWNTIGGSMLAMTGSAPRGVIVTGMEGNVISGNTGTGVVITGASAANNIVQSNYIGTDVLGLADLGNGGGGVLIFDAPDNWVGPAAIAPLGVFVPPGTGNVISGNDLAGVEISGTSATGNVVRSNKIGTDYSGGSAIGNGVNGVRVAAAPGNRVGGPGHGDGNVISGNGSAGVAILGSDASGNEVEGNHIGTDASGYSVVANVGAGVMISDAPGNTIGGTEGGAMNVISGNQTHGVLITGAPSVGNVVQGNSVGVAADGLSPLGNGLHGVLAESSGPNVIGGRSVGEGNEIAFNGMDGVAIVAVPVPSTSKPILGNSIHDNTGLGIDLGDNGIDLNDAGDPDTGANAHQNYPVLTSAVIGASTTIAGTLNSSASTGFFVDFYASDSCDPLGFGEGADYLGSTVVTTDAAGNATFNSTVGGTASPGQRVTATATDGGSNTSEFSACVDVTGGETPTPEPTETPTPTPEPTATATPVPHIQGDTDCDEDVDAVDALWVLKRSAGMEPFSACIDQGDIQCDLDIDSVDSLGILRFVAALPALAQTEPCTDIGLPL